MRSDCIPGRLVAGPHLGLGLGRGDRQRWQPPLQADYPACGTDEYPVSGADALACNVEVTPPNPLRLDA